MASLTCRKDQVTLAELIQPYNAAAASWIQNRYSFLDDTIPCRAVNGATADAKVLQQKVRVHTCQLLTLRAKAQAGAEFLDLRSACAYFYDMGMRLHSMISDDELPIFLMNAFSVRYAELLTKSLTHDSNRSSQEEMKMKQKLTMEERQSCEAVNQLDKWRYNQTMIGRKRKLHIGTS
eukprot:scaffold348621_cov52-Prasinocladus_malaysianus.AAC.1